MNDYPHKQFGNEYGQKMRTFEKLALEIQNSNIEILKSMPNIDQNEQYYLLNNYYYLVGPGSGNNQISFGFNRDYNLPEDLKKKLIEAFDSTFSKQT